MRAYLELFFVLLTVILVRINAQYVTGNCATGRDCDHCPLHAVKWMSNRMAGYYNPFKVCCSNCNRHFFKFNVLWQSYCYCMNIPEIDTSNIQTSSGNIIIGNVGMFNSRDMTIEGNCWSGSNCSNCNNGHSYINGVRFCCPNCSGYGVSVSGINNIYRCRCNMPSEKPQLTGNCLYNEQCNSCSSSSYIGRMRVCCPGCTSSYRSLISNGYSTHCECHV